jgi:hypothetical protein
MIRKRQIEIEEEEVSPFVMMRIGIFEHVKSKAMDPFMMVVYTFMLNLCNWETGVWHGCAAKMAAELNNIWSVKKVERILSKLVKGNYIESHYRKGDYGNYDILINNFVPTVGPNAMKVKLRPVQAGYPLPSDKSVPKSVAVAVGGATVSVSKSVGGSDKNVLGVGMNLSEGQTKSVTEIVGYTISNKNAFQEGFQDGIDGCMDSKPAPKGFDLEEA